MIVKGKLQSPLWAWKGQLVRLKTEVDRALLSILEGIEKCGPAQKPNGAGRKEVGKRWAPRSKARPVCNPKPNLKFGMELGSVLSLVMGALAPPIHVLFCRYFRRRLFWSRR